MIYKYTRHAYRISDGKSFTESLEIAGEQVAILTNRDGRRPDFLELLNRWNRTAATVPTIGANGYIYVYTADTP